MIDQLKVHNLYIAQDDNIVTTHFAALQHIFQNVFKNIVMFLSVYNPALFCGLSH